MEFIFVPNKSEDAQIGAAIDWLNENVTYTKASKTMATYIAFLRGINVGGHHKVPMADLRKEMEKLGFENVETILNSGNILFEGSVGNTEGLEKTIATHMEKTFEFPVPTIVRSAELIYQFLEDDPFNGIEVTKDIRLYISLLHKEVELDLELPWTSEDGSFKILYKKGKNILSVLDLSISQTPKAMGILEKLYGKDITTRNWNTIKRVEKKLDARS